MPSTTTGARSTSLRRGDVVLVPFPYADLSSAKARPALVVSGKVFRVAEGRVIVAGITSNVAAHSGPASIELLGWAAAGLQRPSVVTSWLATVDPRIILMRVGRLRPGDMRDVDKCLCAALEIRPPMTA